jgi:Protein of unknown function (DUF1822)
MSDYLTDEIDFFAGELAATLERSPTDAIILSPAQIDQARSLSQRATDDDKRWSVYLNALAWIGFRQWLQHRAPEITLNSESSSILQPSIADATTATCNLFANEFKLCLIGMESILDDDIAIPRAALDYPDLMAHFYVPMQVDEEQGQVVIFGFLRYDLLSQQRRSSPWAIAPDGTYRLPLTWFEPDINRLLLQLSCLDPAALPLPVHAARAPHSTVDLASLHQILVEPVVNVGTWLQQQWDELAQTVGWMVLPPLELAAEMRSTPRTLGMRSPVAEFNAILMDLERGGMSIPPESQAAYREVNLSDHPLRLYAVTGAVMPANQPPEWFLLIILKTQDGTDLPPQLCLQINDFNDFRVEQISSPQAPADYLYTRVVGTLEEQFLVTLSLPDDTALTLPPFAFST